MCLVTIHEVYFSFCTRLIISQTDEIDLTEMLSKIIEMINSKTQENESVRKCLTATVLQNLLKTVDTEYDRDVIKAILGMYCSRTQLLKLGLKPDIVVGAVDKVMTGAEEYANAYLAAGDMMKLRLNKRITSTNKRSQKVKAKLNRSQYLPEKRILDMQAEVDMLSEQLSETKRLLLKQDKYNERKFEISRKRLVHKLIEDNRLKLRKLGSGRKQMLDSEDEDFICRSVESTATAHGRRHDSVLYLGHRVKKKHLLTLANFNLRNRDKRLIRSATTVYNRSRPRNKCSAEAKRHLGKWLFCTHTPPKTEESAVETTHHRRSHVKNCKFSIFHREKNDGLVISMDDKAYLRPGTDVGARTVRRKNL